MEYTLQPDEAVSDGIKRIIDGKIETGLRQVDSDLDRHETVHEVRKRCKEIRAALRLVRGVLPTYSEENAHYRDAARRLSDIRDAQALIETFDDHGIPAIEAFDEEIQDDVDTLSERLVARRESVTAEQDLSERLQKVRSELLAGRKRVSSLPIATEGFAALEGGLRKSYKRGRNRMAEAYETPEAERFHEWRKRIKYHRYHTRLLRSVWSGPMKARRAELKTLSDLIGDEHDLAVFLETMQAETLFDSDTRRTLYLGIMGRRAKLQRQGRPIGEQLFAESPEALVARIRKYWTAAREYETA
ncbi:MAG: CHAD domain-containing protein [Halobacteriales archaeon]